MRSLMLVFTEPVAGKEGEFDAWYEHTHLPELLALPGFVAAQRWSRSAAGAAGLPGSPHSNLAVYELDGDGEKALTSMMEAHASGALHMSDALDAASVSLWLFNEHGARQVAAS
jgi:hypothetical protein